MATEVVRVIALTAAVRPGYAHPMNRDDFPGPAPTALHVHQYLGLQPGPKLIVLGGVHGDETCGTVALRRLVDALEAGRLQLRRGELTLVPVSNPMAHQAGRREGQRNLNRRLLPVAIPQDHEDRIARVLCPLLARHEVLLDLHSFHTDGEPFVMIGPRDNDGPLEPFRHEAAETALAAVLGVRQVVEGWLEAYARGVARRGGDAQYGIGTTEYMRSVGGWGLTLECGRHDDPAAPEVAWQATLRTLEHLGLIDAGASAPCTQPDFEVMRLVDVIDREAEGDRLARNWCSFDPVRAGEVIGWRADGREVLAPADGRVVFPNPRARAGAEWFYLAELSGRRLG
ncbi:MAG: hypothetical protein RL654_162 [Pseudomonadota bacterium]